MNFFLPGTLRYRRDDIQRYLDRYIRNNAGKGVSVFDHEVSILVAHQKPVIRIQTEVKKSQPNAGGVLMALNTLEERVQYARMANGFSEEHLRKAT